MINDPILEAASTQDIGAILVAGTIKTNRELTLSFNTAQDEFRAIGDEALFGDRPEIGEHWRLSGTWKRDKDRGDYLLISSAQLTLPVGATIQTWLQHNVLGMGTWYPQVLWHEFGERIFEFLYRRQYETLVSETRLLRALPFQLFFDASTAWRAYAAEVAAIEHFSAPILRSVSRRVAPFYGIDAAVAIGANPCALMTFGHFNEIDRALRVEKNISFDDPERILAAADALVSEFFKNGIRAVGCSTFESALANMLETSTHRAQKMVTIAHERGHIRIDGDWIRGRGVLAIERSVASALCGRSWHSATFTELATSDAAAHLIVNSLPVSPGVSVIAIAQYGNAISNLLALNPSALARHALITLHANRLRALYPNAAHMIFSPAEVIYGDHTANADVVVLSEAHAYSISEWAELLGTIRPDVRLVLCGATANATTGYFPWVDICESIPGAHLLPTYIETNQEAIPFQEVWSAMRTGRSLKSDQYQAGRTTGISSVDVASSKCVDAAVGLAHHLRQRNLSVQILCPEDDIRGLINLHIQDSLQLISPSHGRDFGGRKLYVGDPVRQTSLWANNAPIGAICYVEHVYPHAKSTLGSDGRLERKHAVLRHGVKTYELSITQILTLELGYALPTSCASVRGTDVVIVVSSSLQNLDWKYVLEAITIGSSQLVFLGPAAGDFKPWAVREPSNILRPSLFDA